MNKKIFFLLLGFAITISLVIFLVNLIQSKESDLPEFLIEKPNENVNVLESKEILLTDEGFTPSKIEIKPGTKVIWINNSKYLATIDSNPHPMHTENPKLNLGEFKRGEKIEFIFTKPGEFSYHNHYLDVNQGKIIVK